MQKISLEEYIDSLLWGQSVHGFQSLCQQDIDLLVANIAPYITQVTFKQVHYALLINQLRFGLTFLKVLANFPTDKYGLDCGLELNAKVFQLRLNNVSRVLVLEGYDYLGHITSRQFSRSLLILVYFPEACNGCWSATLELTKVLMVELIRWWG